LSRQFDVFQREGLYRFLKFVEAQLENEIDTEPAAPPETNAVRLMSIHQSKGLEFPVVVVADLGKGFNFSDGKGDIILNEKFGLCGKVKPPALRRSYPSLSYWLAQRQQRLDTLGEELRLLYVAMTRAEKRLILAGTASKTKLDGGWLEWAGRGLSATELAESRSALDWIGSWLALRHSDFTKGEDDLLTWRLCEDVFVDKAPKVDSPSTEIPTGALEKLRTRLDWIYPNIPETTRAAKTTVSALRKELSDEEAKPFLKFNRGIKTSRAQTGAKKLSAAEIGSAHHLFLEQLRLEQIADATSLRAEGKRLVNNGLLSEEEFACIDFDGLAQFWQSSVAREIVCRHHLVRRELPFTARFAADDFADVSPDFAPPPGEFVIVQGVVDLAVISEDQIWILDFKTDHVTVAAVNNKVSEYRPQLALYARALERIYNRPVTKRWLHFLAIGKTVAL
jgi:ATP-dependent helicase/nuclease subunit A